MKIALFLLPFFFLFSCKNQAPAITTMEKETTNVEQYRLLSKEFKNEEAQTKAYKKAKNYFSMNPDSGNFEGEIEGIHFTGNFEIKNISSGFVKGFSYKVTLGYLSSNTTENTKAIAFFEHLSEATKLYFYPDNLANPTWHFLEITATKNDKKLIFARNINL